MLSFFPTAQELKDFLLGADDESIHAFFQSVYTEGPPRASESNPIDWGKVRERIASEFTVNSKHVFLVGSAKSGFTLSPIEFGRRFDASSDVDMSVISKEYVANLQEDFKQWKSDYESGLVSPTNSNEKKHWDSNKNLLPGNFKRGFVDYHKIPAQTRYQTRFSLINIVARVTSLLASVGIRGRHVSIRFFTDFDAFQKQHTINLKSVSKKIV